MSKFKKALNYYNILNIINNNSSQDHLKNCTEYIVNDDKAIIFLLVNNNQWV